MSSPKSRKIIFVHPYPKGKAPGQRFRYEQYQRLLMKEGYELYFHPFLNENAAAILYEKGFILQKAWGVLSGFISRWLLMFRINNASAVFVYREAAPFGPPLFEWIIAKVLRKPLIYDFDDAIWTTDKHESTLVKLLRWRKKTAAICRWAAAVSCGNEYLCYYARRYNANVVLNPTTIDMEALDHTPSTRPAQQSVTIGWSGSHSTLKYLGEVIGAIRFLEKKYPSLQFLVIADHKPSFELSALRYRRWSEAKEMDDLKELDIGIMPLPDDEWTRGKCGFKALQYMALGIPTVASPVGVNTKILTSGTNGLLANTESDWIMHLDSLITSSALRQALGSAGVDTVVNSYSVQSNSRNFLQLITEAIEPRRL